MAIVSPNTIDTTLMQDGRPAASITPAVFRQIVDSLAGIFNGTPQTGSTYTVALADRGALLEFNASTAQTLLIPTDANAAFDVGTVIGWYQMGTGQLTIQAVTTGTTAVRSSSSLLARAQFSTGTIRKRSANEWVAAGDLV